MFKGILKVLALALAFSSSVVAQGGAGEVGIRANLAGGEVVAMEPGRVRIKTKDGEITALIGEKTEVKRVPPENPSLGAAVAADISAIGVGDKVLVTGAVSAARTEIAAKAFYLMTKSDLANRQRKESEEWRQRGIAGRVTGYNPQTSAITVSVRGLMGERTVTVLPKDKAEFLRYSPDSVQFSDAKKSSISDIETGDTIRALGDKSVDGAQIAAEKIVTGAFITVAGTVSAIDTEKGEVTIADVQSKKPVTVVVGGNSVLKQFPAEMAQRFAGMGGGMGGAQVRPAGQTGPPAGQAPQQGGMGMGMRGAGASSGIDDLLERFPNIKISDLKVGEMIAVSSSKGKDSSRIRAIKLLSGVEPLIRAQQASPRPAGGRGAGSGFEIPGLDGFNF